MLQFFIRLLEKIFAPIITKDGYLKLPKNKKLRFWYLYAFMLVIIMASIVYVVLQNILWDLPVLIINWLK